MPLQMTANPALNLAPFSRWTLRDKAAQKENPGPGLLSKHFN